MTPDRAPSLLAWARWANPRAPEYARKQAAAFYVAGVIDLAELEFALDAANEAEADE